jgi:thiol:disulfide interchange protein DsbD
MTSFSLLIATSRSGLSRERVGAETHPASPHQPASKAARAGWLLLGCLFGVTVAAAEPEVLRPEKAFRYQATIAGNDIEIRWRIEPGYYLYKERMSYATSTPGVRLGPPALPSGIPYHDEFFGDMEVYRNEARVRIPVLDRPGTAAAMQLEVKSQGCADIGLCYPPQVWTATVALATSAPSQAIQTPGFAGPGGAIGRILGQPAPVSNAPLPPEVAFRAHGRLIDQNTLQVTWDIAAGYYLYRDSLRVVGESPGVTLGPLQLPAGEPKEDEYFGATEVYFVETSGQAAVNGRVPPEGLRLRISQQGCKENSICYPPQTVALNVEPVLASAVASTAPPSAPMVSEQDRLATLIATGNLGLVMATFAGLGLLLSFTPCCLPMLPILSGIIVGQGPGVTTVRAFGLSLAYVLGMAVTYTAAGAAFAAAGAQIQATLQQPAIIIGVSLLFVALALAMFGLYELQLPASLLNRLTAASSRQRGGTLFGTAAMGALSALVVTTCVAPPLVGALSFIAQSGDITRGALALFAMAMGMGAPLLAIGASAGRLLPKAGPWMNAVKAVFGILLLGLAVWMLDRILPDGITMVLWGLLALLTGVMLGAFRPFASGATAIAQAARGLGLVAVLYGIALFVGAWSGANNPLQPLAAMQANGQQQTAGIGFRRIKTVADLDAALAAAAGRPAMLDFYADWCTSCIEMERYTFPEPEVRAALGDMLLLQADVTANDAEDQALLRHFGIFGPPTLVFFDADGRERDGARVVGFMPADEFAAHVRRANGS